MTLYDELELTPDCSFEDIKQQYRLLAKKHHPDLGGDEEKFKRIKFAYEVLSDPSRRKQYDENKTTDVPIDIRKEAINELAKLFFGLIPTFDCVNGNLVDKMKNETTAMQMRIKANIALNEGYIKNLQIVKDKLKIKNPNEDDILMNFIDKQLESRYSDKKMFEHQLNITEYMIPILDNYNYGFLELFDESVSLQTDVGSEPIVP